MASAQVVRPSVFYKYLTPARVDVLRDLKIRFTQVSALNDPFESLPGVVIRDRDWYLEKFRDRVENEIVQLGMRSQVKKKQYRCARKKAFEHFFTCSTDLEWLTSVSEEVRHMSDTVQGCLSLSATSTNVLMWAHYAQNHEGFVLGFRAEHEYFGDSVSPVVYSSTRPAHDPFECRHDGAIFYTKSADWSYEQEYRKFESFVEPIKLRNGNRLSPYASSGSSPGHNEAIVLLPIPSDSIACVILGWKSSRDLQASITGTLEIHQLDRIPIYRARPSSDRYEVEVIPAKL
jgi:hypothetical protein